MRVLRVFFFLISGFFACKGAMALQGTFDNMRAIYLDPSVMKYNPTVAVSNMNVGFSTEVFGNGTGSFGRRRLDFALNWEDFIQVGLGTSRVVSNSAYSEEAPPENYYDYSALNLSFGLIAGNLVFGIGFSSQSSLLGNFEAIDASPLQEVEKEFLDVVYAFSYRNDEMSFSVALSGIEMFSDDEEPDPFENTIGYEHMDSNVFLNRTVVANYYETNDSEFTNIIEGKFLVRDNVINYHIMVAFVSPVYAFFPFERFEDERLVFLNDLDVMGGLLYQNASKTLNIAAGMKWDLYEGYYYLSYGYRRPLGVAGASANHEVSVEFALDKLYSRWVSPLISEGGGGSEDDEEDGEFIDSGDFEEGNDEDEGFDDEN